MRIHPVADMWDADDQQYAIAFVVLSSVGGSVVGPIVGGFLQANLDWHWNFWVQLIFGGAVQAIHFFLVPETLPNAILDKEAKRRRKIAKKGRSGSEKANEMDRVLYGPGELKEERFSMKEILLTWSRPVSLYLYSAWNVTHIDLNVCAIVRDVRPRAHCPLLVASVRFLRRSHFPFP